MYGVFASTGVGVPWPSNLNEYHKHKPHCTSSSIPSHLPINKSAIVRKTRHQHVYRTHCSSSQVPITVSDHHHISSLAAAAFSDNPSDQIAKISRFLSPESLVLVDLDPATAKLAIGFLGPFLSAFGFLFILRIIMSWYPKLPVEKFPYVIAYAPTEPLLVQTRKVIPPLAGVDVTPVVWFGLLSFLNEILVGPQGLLVLLSQQISS